MSDKKIAVLVVAAGHGKRFGGPLPKQYALLGDKPVLAHTIAALASHPLVDVIRIVIAEGFEDELASCLPEASDQVVVLAPVLAPVTGGPTRQASVRLGLESLVEEQPDIVLIHDGARPFPSHSTLSTLIETLEQSAGAYAAIPVSDTLRRLDGDGATCEEVSRDALWRAQTPQGFAFDAILAAHRQATHDDFTDDVAVAEAFGLKVAVVEDTPSNFKITNAGDLELAEAILSSKSGARVTRTGFGYDVHRFEAGRPLILCGIEFPDAPLGLKGHSDADVALHALTDAILGAIGCGDIGQHFPPSDDQWKGAPSSVFIAKAMDEVKALDGTLINADITIICESPKIGPVRDIMRKRCAELLGCAVEAVNIKATTTEGLGFTGRGEGIAAQAVVAVALPAKLNKGN